MRFGPFAYIRICSAHFFFLHAHLYRRKRIEDTCKYLKAECQRGEGGGGRGGGKGGRPT
jgi:hypothetical protein